MHRDQKSFIKPVFAALALASVSACATGGYGPSVFDSASVADSKTLSSVDRVYVAPVGFDLEPFVRSSSLAGRNGDGQRPVSDRDLEALAKRFQADMTRALEAKGLTVIDAAQPGAATVSAVLTRVDSSRPSFADLSDNPGLSAQSLYSGGGAVTITVDVDGSTVATFSDSERESISNRPPAVGIWEDLYRDFDVWAAGLAGAF